MRQRVIIRTRKNKPKFVTSSKFTGNTNFYSLNEYKDATVTKSSSKVLFKDNIVNKANINSNIIFNKFPQLNIY